MPISTIALKGKFGSTNYYVTSMRAQEISGIVRAANETDVWSNEGIDERLQREPNWNRIQKQITPYLVNNKDRFFGGKASSIGNLLHPNQPKIKHPISKTGSNK